MLLFSQHFLTTFCGLGAANQVVSNMISVLRELTVGLGDRQVSRSSARWYGCTYSA